MNTWSFTGNLGNDAETRFAPSGDAIVSFSVAATAGYGDKQTTTWAKCIMFGKRGEAVSAYLTKGTKVGIVGEVALKKWKNKDGIDVSTLEVRVNDLTLLGSKPEAGQAPARKQAEKPRAEQPLYPDDDIPF
jgi:single-strand DNA-binding protein